MRRAYLFAGIAAGAIVLFTTVTSVSAMASSGRAEQLENHMKMVQDVAFCHKGYEIAASFPSFASRRAVDFHTKINLLQQSDRLEAQKDQLGRLLYGTFKTQAIDLGMNESSYNDVLAKFEARAEVEAVVSYQSVQEPQEFLDKLEEVCAPYVSHDSRVALNVNGDVATPDA